jgi:hypothetical protein
VCSAARSLMTLQQLHPPTCKRGHFPRNPVYQEVGVKTALISLGACSGGKFVVSRAGEAYDARVRGPQSELPTLRRKAS